MVKNQITLVLVTTLFAVSLLTQTCRQADVTTQSPVNQNSTARVATSPFSLTWTYNFTGTINTSDWNVYAGPFGSSSNTCFEKQNAAIKNGQLVLTISKTANGCGRKYTSGGIDTWANHAQTYGRWEVVAQFPAGFGTTGYIGLFPTNGSWPPEVDFAESIARQPTNLFLTQHYGTTNQTNGFVYKPGTNWTTGFHTYALEWTPTTLTYYVDGIVRQTQPVQFSPTPMKLAIGTGTGDCGSWVDCPENKPASSPGLPAQMYVKSVSIYKYMP
jgi:beta-glucanase (GH16 family)